MDQLGTEMTESSSSAPIAGGVYWSEVGDDETFAQGDIVRRIAGEGRPGEFGLVLTADCDFAQRKNSNRLSYIEVVTIGRYLDDYWAPDQLAKHLQKQVAPAAQQIAASMRRSGSDLSLDETQLVDWLKRRTVEQVEAAVGVAFDAKLSRTLEGVRCATDDIAEPTALGRWVRLRRLLGDSVQQVRGTISAAFAGSGFPDYFVLPELPGSEEYGHVAVLRSMRTVPASEVHVSEIEARISDRPHELHRVGRLPDGIRFAFAQKIAFLFSRIGLPEHYEAACSSAATLAAESMINGD